MPASAEGNFGGRLVARLGPDSRLIDAATRRVIRPEDLPGLIAAHGRSLLSAGLKKGDRVLVGCTLSPATALAYWGAIYAGLIVVPVEERAMVESLPTLLDTTGARAVWTETGLRRGGSDNGSTLFVRGNLASDASTRMPPTETTESDLATLMPTSGSSGVPRFVMISHGNLIANTEAIISSQALTPDDTGMVILPLSYCFGASVMHTHLYAGGSVVFDRRFMFPDKVLKAVNEYGCTTFAGVPTVYNVLLRRSGLRRIDMPSLRRFLQAGGRLAPERINEMRASLPETKFYVMYGQTEATARISCMEPERWEEKVGSVGRPLNNVTLRIVDEQGNRLPAGQCGHLTVKGPSISSGYWNDPKETQRVFRDGWLRTGDLARQDEEGYVWIEGRQGAFLKMRGMRLNFAEVEATVATIPGVYDCASRAVENPESGEALELFIVPDHGASLGVEDIRPHLPAHWMLDSIHFVSELPMTSTGKISLSAAKRSLHAIAG